MTTWEGGGNKMVGRTSSLSFRGQLADEIIMFRQIKNLRASPFSKVLLEKKKLERLSLTQLRQMRTSESRQAFPNLKRLGLQRFPNVFNTMQSVDLQRRLRRWGK